MSRASRKAARRNHVRQNNAARKEKLKRELTNLPNLITYIRILVIPFVIYLLVHESAFNGFVAGLLYALAATTDALDGYLARRSGQVSLLGKFLDPLADKLFVISILISMVPMGRVPAWLVCVIVAREITITGLRAVAAGEGLIIAASDSGKLKTSFQLTAIVALLFHYRYTLDFLILPPVSADLHRVGMAMLYISLFFSLKSAAAYFYAFLIALTEEPTSPQKTES